MSDLEMELERWRQMVSEPRTDDASEDPDDNTAIMIIESWAPRVKWFQPPRWKIFRWAYHISATAFTGVYPSAIFSDCMTIQSSMGTKFSCKPYSNDQIDRLAGNLRKQLEYITSTQEKEERQC